MSIKNSYLTVTDQFCGAGGSSQGARKLSPKNGWRLRSKVGNESLEAGRRNPQY